MQMNKRRYRIATRIGDQIRHSGNFVTVADADRSIDGMTSGKHWVEVWSELVEEWQVLTYANAIFHDSGRDILIDIDGTGRWELFSSCANEHDARNMAKHYQEQHNPQH
jgi:hypothetical protein